MTAAPAGEPSWRQIFEHAPAAMVVVSADGVITAANQQFRALAGPERANAAGRRLWDMLAPAADDAAKPMDLLADSCVHPVRWRGGDGSVAALSLAVGRDGHDPTAPFICTLQDHGAERRQADGRLLELLRAVRSDDAMHWFDRDGRIVFANDQACALLGYRRDEMLGMTVWDLNPWLTREAWARNWATTQRRGSHVFETRHRRKDGSDIAIEVTRATLYLDDREIGLSFSRDISARKQAEAALRETIARLRMVIDNVPVVLLALDRDGVFTLSEGRALAHLGRTPAEVVGTSAFELYRDHPVAQARIRRALRGEAFSAEFDLAGRRMVGHYAPVHDAAGALQGSIGIMFDITERAEAEQALQKLNVELEDRVARRTSELQAANDSLSDALAALQRTQQELVRSEKLASLGSLVAGVSHELSTPIGNCVMLASTLKERAAAVRREVAEGALKRSTLDDFAVAFRDGIEILERNLARANQLLASFKQVSVDQASQQRRRFDLRITIEEVVATLSPMLGKNRHRLLLDLPDNLHLDGFPGALAQVVINLVTNALTHAFDPAQGGGTMRLAAMASGEGRVRIVFSDDGAGIDPDLLGRIFDPFVTTRRGRGGSGLGLHIVHNFVTNVLGGNIAVASRPGAGATFTIELPVVSPTRRADGAPVAGASASPFAA